MSEIMKLNSKDHNIWFTSDSHYFHKNITYGESMWNDKEINTRRFNTTQEMSQAIVKGINRHVKYDDILFHLGDWSFGGIQNIWNFNKQINCQNIHLIFGNHDQHIISNKLLPDILVNAQSPILFSSTQHYLEVEIDNILFLLFHRAIEDFHNNERKTTIHLHGHSHGNTIQKENRLDVGVDVAYKKFGEYRPFSLQEVLKILNK